MEGQFNYLGAAVFWLYIAAALFFSILVIHTIVKLGTSNSSQRHHSRDVKIFSALARISFVTLRYNMLNVLIESFFAWHQQQDLPGRPGLVDIWKWSIESTLFQDFGEAILAPTLRQIWTLSALVATMSVCLFMGTEGISNKHNQIKNETTTDSTVTGQRRQVPRLSAFFCLSQILPITFAQNLFYLALLRLPQTEHRVAAPWGSTVLMAMVYNISLLIARHGGTWLLSGIFMARITLFSPLLLCNLLSDNTGPTDNTDLMGNIEGGKMQQILLCSYMYIYIPRWGHAFSRSELPVREVLNALFEHPAVSSLGYDLILCALSFGIWTLTSRNRNLADATADDKVEQSG
jgi:hypothetical protein